MADDNRPFDFDQLPDDDLGPRLNATVWSLTAVSGLFLGLRLYCKFTRRRGLWLDDHFLIAAWIALILLSSFATVAVGFDLGKHSWNIDQSTFAWLLLHGNLSGSFSIVAAAWSKTSFALTLQRLASERWMRWLIWFLIVSMNLVLGGAVLITWVQCSPVDKTWRTVAVEGTCWPQHVHRNYNIASSAYSGAMDVLLAMLPWRMIWGLELTRREKLGVLIAMSMGVFAGIVSFVKISTLHAIGDSDMIETVDLVIWGAAESAVTIIAASIPVLRAMFQGPRAAGEPRMGTREKALLRRLNLFSSPSTGGGTNTGTQTKPDKGVARGTNNRNRGNVASTTKTAAAAAAAAGITSPRAVWGVGPRETAHFFEMEHFGRRGSSRGGAGEDRGDDMEHLRPVSGDLEQQSRAGSSPRGWAGSRDEEEDEGESERRTRGDGSRADALEGASREVRIVIRENPIRVNRTLSMSSGGL
ncbi:hypothetical protein VD0002_g9730 [Verticillium dahliae]|uniref:Rhodopsin domain-containing protein n=1 Tax=Verticillium dahliae TaxID=27337 RepID=A0AA44WE16_VERDA|nr:hypothetical protein VdG2_00117 [Verticillium dahliae VDG2]KAH6708657.1 hypothetical protein EV126DRAFT_484897 [Verticillium dahliae]PNH29415.1 hypothetical protein BJF96_g7370 [Verticillium dahliae]PNH42535.1 hypothetical protein VD0003_g9785 [Verticillium dahliae]PNH57150.1 hypothetical protein VD0002_g9730 [Verticillium dahliae]